MAEHPTTCVDFSPDGNLLAIFDEQGTLRVWDVETSELRQEYSPSLHLAGPCTTFIWLQLNIRTAAAASKKSPLKKKESKIRKTNDKNQLFIAFGTRSGKVALYSYAEGKLQCNLGGEGHSGKVTGIWQGSDNLLYTCSDDSKIITWCLATMQEIDSWPVGSEKFSSIIDLPISKAVAVGSRQITVYKKKSRDILESFTGHTGDVRIWGAICSADKKDEYILSTSNRERIICLWKLGVRPKASSATCNFLMEDISHSVSWKVDEKDDLKLASVTRSGVIHFYFINLKGLPSTKPIKPSVTIEVVTDVRKTLEPVKALAASLLHIRSPNDVLFAYGSERFLVVEQVKLEFTDKKQILMRADPKARLLKNNNEDQSLAALKVYAPIVDPNDVEYKSSLNISKVPKRMKDTEIPFDMRLRDVEPQNSKFEKESMQSKAHLLIQALHSKDYNLLQAAFHTNDLAAIDYTMQRLPIEYVDVLLGELTSMLQKKHLNVVCALRWFKFLMQTHMSQLMALSNIDLLEKFGPCLELIEQRKNCLQDIYRLQGRLHFLAGQTKRKTQQILNIEDTQVYEDDQVSLDSELDYIINDNLKKATLESVPDDDDDDDDDDVDDDDADDNDNANDVDIAEDDDDEDDDDSYSEDE